jgi:hypothetical protein
VDVRFEVLPEIIHPKTGSNPTRIPEIMSKKPMLPNKSRGL